jgi:hypothetical protein
LGRREEMDMETRTHNEIPFMKTILSVLLFLFMITGAEPLPAQSVANHRPGVNARANAVDIARDPTDVPSPIANRAPTVVHVTLTAKEVLGQLDPSVGTTYRYWTFDGKVPGPMIRVRQGDTVEVRETMNKITGNTSVAEIVTHQVFAHTYMGSHRHAFTVGFISMMILGVSSRVVPILAGIDAKRINSLWAPFVLLNIGCAGRVLLQVLTDFVPKVAYPLIGFTGFIELTALLWWGIELWRTMNVAKTSRTKLLTAPFPLVAQ